MLSRTPAYQLLVVSTAKTSNFMVQLARDPFRAQVFQELLDSRGMEFYLRHAPLYSPSESPEQTVSFDELASAALERSEIAIGYTPLEKNIAVLSPSDRENKKPAHLFGQLVVISEN